MRSFSKERAKKTFSFETQNEIGKLGELAFAARYPKVSRKGLKECDFELPDGTWAELKTDSRPAKATENFFFEAFGNLERNIPGGPWQAYGKGADYLVYVFACGAEYWFNCAALVEFLDKTEDEWEVKQVQNTSWSAAGLLVPISRIAHLFLEVPQCVKS